MSGAHNGYGGARFSSCGVHKVLPLYIESAVVKEEAQKLLSFFFYDSMYKGNTLCTPQEEKISLPDVCKWGSESILLERDEQDTVSKQISGNEIKSTSINDSAIWPAENSSGVHTTLYIYYYASVAGQTRTFPCGSSPRDYYYAWLCPCVGSLAPDHTPAGLGCGLGMRLVCWCVRVCARAYMSKLEAEAACVHPQMTFHRGHRSKYQVSV